MFDFNWLFLGSILSGFVVFAHSLPPLSWDTQFPMPPIIQIYCLGFLPSSGLYFWFLKHPTDLFLVLRCVSNIFSLEAHLSGVSINIPWFFTFFLFNCFFSTIRWCILRYHCGLTWRIFSLDIYRLTPDYWLNYDYFTCSWCGPFYFLWYLVSVKHHSLLSIARATFLGIVIFLLVQMDCILNYSSNMKKHQLVFWLTAFLTLSHSNFSKVSFAFSHMHDVEVIDLI